MTEDADSKTNDAKTTVVPKQGRWWALVLVLIGAVGGATANYFYTQYNSRVRTWDYGVTQTDSLFKKPELTDRELKITLDNKTISNVSTSVVWIYNTTDQDFEDVPINIAIQPVNGQKALLIQAKIQTPQELVEEATSPESKDLILRKTYKLKVGNRSNQPIFGVSFVFESEKAPDIDVSVHKKGLIVNKRPLQEILNPKTWNSFIQIFIVVVTSLAAVLAGFIFGKMSAWAGERIARKRNF